MKGLTAQEVTEARARGKVNVQVSSSSKTTGDIVRENVCTYFNLIFLIIAILVIIAGDYRSLTFLPVVIVNTLIGIYQELNAKKVLDQLNVLNEPTAIVVRDGAKHKISIHDLVESDIILLSEGNQIPADAVVIAGEVSCNEALLTGEADEILHKKGEKLMSGSFIVSGRCYAKLTAVGEESYISRLMIEAKGMESKEQSEMVRSINAIVKLAGLMLIPIGLALFFQSYISQGNTFRQSVSSMVAAVIGMIPEGLYLLVSVTLALGAMKLAKRKVMLHDMKSIETLARVDVLCVDKTGTITDNAMLVADTNVPDQIGEAEKIRRFDLIADYIRAVPDQNITMQALRDYFPAASGREPEKALKVMPFSSKYKYSSVKFSSGVYVLGAPDIVLGSNYEACRTLVEENAGAGYRVLAFVKAQGAEELPERGISKEDTGIRMQPILFILLENPIRENAKTTFEYFKAQGVEVKVISGDNAITVSRVARNAGVQGAEAFVDAGQLKTDEDVAQAVEKYTVFGRVKPEQKQQIVRALQSQGHTVAMTGDGVNDILAMKDADCSIAMAAGSDAAVQASQVVLLDSDFSHMPQIVGEGRQIINNIERSATLFLVKNIFSMLLAIFSIVSVMVYPLRPAQISLISGFNIGIPAFFLALEPNEQRIQGRFIRKVLLRALPAALTDFLIIAALVVFGNTFGVKPGDISVAATVLLAIVGFIILYNISAPMNRYRRLVISGCMFGMVVCALVLHDLYGITYVSVKCTMLFVIFAIVTEPMMRYLTKLAMWLDSHFDKRENKKQA